MLTSSISNNQQARARALCQAAQEARLQAVLVARTAPPRSRPREPSRLRYPTNRLPHQYYRQLDSAVLFVAEEERGIINKVRLR